MNKRIFAVVALAAVLGLAAAWWFMRDENDADTLVLHGNVDVRQVSLAFETNGRIAELKVEEGDQVKAGDALAVLDTSTFSLETDQAAARAAADEQNLLRMRRGARPEEIMQARERLAAAQAEAGRSAAELGRLRQVSANTQGRGVAELEIDRAAAAAKASAAHAQEAGEALKLVQQGPRQEDVAMAQAQFKASQAGLALSRHRFAQGVLRAPADAVVRARLLEPGDMASPQRPVFELALENPKWIRVYVDEVDLGRVKPGMAARVFTDSAPDKGVPGKVGYISSVAEFTPKSVETEDLRTSLVYEVRVRVDDRAGLLRLGQPVTVRLGTGAAR